MDKPTRTTTDDKLEEILEHLRNMDKRDRLRTIGGFFRGLLGIIPILALLGSIYVAYYHTDDLMRMIGEQAAQQAEMMLRGGTNR
jgi:hypothetical protein